MYYPSFCQPRRGLHDAAAREGGVTSDEPSARKLHDLDTHRIWRSQTKKGIPDMTCPGSPRIKQDTACDIRARFSEFPSVAAPGWRG
jgi:hypothetical protein